MVPYRKHRYRNDTRKVATMAEIDTTTGEFVSHARECSDLVESLARVWMVDTSRGDLFLVSVADNRHQLVQLEGSNNPQPGRVMGKVMKVLCDSHGDVVAMSTSVQGYWSACSSLSVPSVELLESQYFE